MNAHRALESFARQLQRTARARQRRVAREQLGVCLCGLALADHFDDANRFLPHSESDRATQPMPPAAPRAPQSAHEARELAVGGRG